jgi:hypothetical protein
MPNVLVVIPCTLKLLPERSWIAAADRARRINPANGVAYHMLRRAAPRTVMEPAHLALLTSKYWGPSVRLSVAFFDTTDAALRGKIVSHMNAWSAYANVEFVETAATADADVRITREPGGGYWSYLGTDINFIDKDEPTMSLESFTINTSDAEFRRVVRHETGHTLGFPHEHLRHAIADKIIRDEAIRYYHDNYGWSEDEVIDQVLTPLDDSALIATAQPDAESIMCYWLPAEIMNDGVAVTGGSDIDAMDAEFAASVYPWWRRWTWADQGAPPAVGVAAGVGAITMMDNPYAMQRPFAFVQGTDGHLWVNWWTGNSWNWADLRTPPNFGIAEPVGVLTMMDNPNAVQRPYVFVRGTDGHLWVNWWNGNSWSWADLSTPPNLGIAEPVGVLTMMDNPNAVQRPYVFVRGTDGHLWVDWWDGAAWNWTDLSTPHNVGIAEPVGVLTMMDNPGAVQRPYVFVRGTDGHLWVDWWDGAWNWTDLSTPPNAGIAEAVGVLTMMANPDAVQRPYVFVRGTDGHLWVDWWDGAWNWTDLSTPPNVGIAEAVGVLTMMANPDAVQRPYVFVRGTDGHLWVNWWDGAGWNWTDLTTPPNLGIAEPVGVLTMMDNPGAVQRPYVFVRGTDGHLWVNWWG